MYFLVELDDRPKCKGKLDIYGVEIKDKMLNQYSYDSIAKRTSLKDFEHKFLQGKNDS